MTMQRSSLRPGNYLSRCNRKGAMLVLVAVVLVILLIGAVFSVDVAYMHMVRAELRTATDAAARAGSETLARTQDPNAAIEAAIAVAQLNSVAGDGLSLSINDIELGSLAATNGRYVFQPNGTPTTAIRITGRRQDDSLDGAVSLFFARVFSTDRFQPVESATAAASVRDIALVLDVSGSMSQPAGTGTRLSALQAAVHLFLDEIEANSPASQVSLTVYSTSPEKLVDLTPNLQLIRNEVDQFQANGMTAIGNALTMGSDSLFNDPLTRPYADKTIIVMTDGNHNTGPSPDTSVATAVARDQQVHTVTFSSGANQTLMQSVANATRDGMHLHADDAEDLGEVFREIARTLSVVLVD